MKCDICGSTKISSVGKPKSNELSRQFLRNDYKVMQCLNCEFYFIYPKIDFSQEEWSFLYGTEYFGEMTKWHKNERLTSLKMRIDKLASYCSEKGKKNFLDVGCGEGYALLEAYSKGFNLYAFDISDNRLPEVKHKDIEFRKGNIFEVNYPDNFFDILYMDSVLEHVLNPKEYLNEIKRIMKKGAALYIGIPNENSLLNDVRKLFLNMKGENYSAKLRPFQQPYHVVGYTEKTINTLSDILSLNIAELNNFAAKFEFRKYSVSSKSFWEHLMMLPVDITAIFLKREAYFEAIMMK